MRMKSELKFNLKMCFQSNLYSLANRFTKQNKIKMRQYLNIRHNELFTVINNKKASILWKHLPQLFNQAFIKWFLLYVHF